MVLIYFPPEMLLSFLLFLLTAILSQYLIDTFTETTRYTLEKHLLTQLHCHHTSQLIITLRKISNVKAKFALIVTSLCFKKTNIDCSIEFVSNKVFVSNVHYFSLY